MRYFPASVLENKGKLTICAAPWHLFHVKHGSKIGCGISIPAFAGMTRFGTVAPTSRRFGDVARI